MEDLTHLHSGNEGHPTRNRFAIRVTFIGYRSRHVNFHLGPASVDILSVNNGGKLGIQMKTKTVTLDELSAA